MIENESAIKENLESTCRVIADVYLPIESKNNEIKLLLEKYSSIITQSMIQVTGSKSINFPAKLDQYASNPDEPTFKVMEELRQFLVILKGHFNGRHQTQTGL